MPGFVGMVTEEVTNVAKLVDGEATKLQADITALGNKIAAAQWKGPDREKFIADWGNQKAQFTKVCEMLRATARVMISNATQQDQASNH